MDAPRVLLVWPGATYGGGGNFGVPQLLSIASSIERATSASVEIMDLDVERLLPNGGLRARLRERWDVVGISCYSSFDFLKVVEIAKMVREAQPRAWIVTGGYHPSALPDEMREPFDYVVVGDGELPMARLVRMLEAGKRPLGRVLGPEPTPDPNELAPYDWDLLARYLPVARSAASQAEIYLSRGCPYDCAFCMERAKRDTSWRAIDPERAVEEMHRLDRFLDLRSWTVFVADALFGMKDAWRKRFLEGLAKRPIRATRTWLLIRIDLVDREDMELMARANVSPGFGLESGDPSQLRRIRKAGKLDRYLDKMMDIAEWARELEVPFGANVIVGHPGETEETLRTSAKYLARLFASERGTMGFLSVDPFRLYPGSPISEERDRWEQETGMRVHRFPWWHDGDQELLSEWVDPSRELDYQKTRRLERELFDPIVRAVPERFSYRGPAREYFLRAVREQAELTQPKRALHQAGLLHLWSELLERPLPIDDPELVRIARARREEVVRGIACAPEIARALVEVPRERFVRPEDIARSAEDVALALTEDGESTISALHAYARSFDAIELGEGDALVDLGAGTGYGCALARRVVGARGSVLGIEIVPELATWAERVAPGAVVLGNAHDVSRWRGARKVVVGFSLARMPDAWLEALAPGGKIVAPIGTTLVLFTKQGTIEARDLGEVRYVGDRAA